MLSLRKPTNTNDVTAAPSKIRRALLSNLPLVILLLISVFLNVLLARRVKTLNIYMDTLKAEGRLAIGSMVPSIEARDIDGNPISVSYSDSRLPTILYVFTPQCGWCSRNLNNVKALSNHTRGKYRFIGLSLSTDKLRDYMIKHYFEFPVYSNLQNGVTTTYKMGGTPQTIVVSAEGRVLKNWIGAYGGNISKEIEEYFDTQLPGLIEEK